MPDYNYIVSELNALIANAERVKRAVEEMQREESGPPAPVQHQNPRPPAPKPDEIRDPLAKSVGDLVTPKQLGMIRALAREAGLDMDEECRAVFKCTTDELSKRAASSFIEHLQRCKAELERPRKVG